jgi:hypothetical protein
LFSKDEKIQKKLRDTLLKMTKPDFKIERLDRVLLKGFYTHDRVELENPCLLKEKDLNSREESKTQNKTNALD